MSLSLWKYCPPKLFVLLLVFNLSATSLLIAQTRQLRQFKVESVSPSGAIPVFTDYPSQAAIIIRSSLTNLSFESTLAITAQLGDPSAGEYVLIVPPQRQSISITAPGFITDLQTTGNLNARDIRYFNIEPLDRLITETGTLIVRSQPEGATIAIDGIPGTFTTPYTFDELLAQTYTVNVTMSDYEPQQFQVNVDPTRPAISEVNLVPTFGFLSVSSEAEQLFLSSDAFPNEYRVNFTTGTPQKLDKGSYRYRLSRQFYQDAVGSLTIEPGGRTSLNVTQNPDFATLRVISNVSSAALSATDNNAPASTQRDLLYLERGIREVTVSANGFEPLSLSIRAESGALIDTTVTLISVQQAAERRRIESLPRGVLVVQSDVDAEIFVNGVSRGRGEVSLTLTPDTYSIEARHPLGTKRYTVRVPAADVISHRFDLKPKRSTALGFSAVIPGGGQMYTKKARGYLYLGATAALGALTYLSWSEQQNLQSDYDASMASYRTARNVAMATTFRAQALGHYNKQLDANNQMKTMILGAIGVYAIQLVDIIVTKPRYGYRESTEPRLQAGVSSNGLTLSFKIH
jgi:hypothetical protein